MQAQGSKIKSIDGMEEVIEEINCSDSDDDQKAVGISLSQF